MKNVNELISEVGDLRSNPANVQRVVLNALETMVDGEYDVVDPSNPFIFLLESACVTASAAMMRSEVLTRQQYPSLAQSQEELYHHMSDVDYANRFAIPAKATMNLLFSLDEIIERAVEDEYGVSKMVIPRDTEITVEGTTFTLQYPIEIRVMSHGGVQVVYNTNILSPLQTLDSNIIDWSLVQMPGSAGDLGNIKLMRFEIPMYQFKITTQYDQLNSSSGFSKTYAFNDQFYYARVYTAATDSSEWMEIHTTHSEQVYDPTKVTAKLTVLDSQLKVDIPQIYFTNSNLSAGIRIDIYTTKGQVELILERYQPKSFQVNWRDLNKTDSKYVAPIRAFSTVSIFSTEKVSGGRNALSLEELRERIINNALGEIRVPITSSQLEAQLDNLGYDIVKDIDNITNRIYLASRSLPNPSTENLSTAVGCTINTMQASISDLSVLDTIRNNGKRVTIESGTLFYLRDSRLTPVENTMLSTLANANNETIAQLLNLNKFVYTPFHYVLDSMDNRFECRPYYLDNPTVNSKQFIYENQTTRLEIATLRYGISKTANGYKLIIITRSGDIFRGLNDDQINAQLSFVPDGEIDRAYLNGVFVGRTDANEYTFEFNIDTNFDIDSDDNLQLTSFKMYDLEDHVCGIPLRSNIDLIYLVSDYSVDGMETSDLDNMKGNFLLPGNTRAIIRESLNITFGDALHGLWSRSRSVASSIDYVKYDNDVPAVYEDVIYKTDPITGTIDITYDGTDITYTVLHNAGDPVLDGDGLPVMKYKKGDVKLDNDGLPIALSTRTMLRQVDILLFEGGFKLATDLSIQTYAKEATETIVKWVSEDVTSIQERLLENTSIWYYPQVTLGNVDVVVEDGISTAITSDQSFRVKFYLSRIGYDNLELRTDLSNTAVEVIGNALNNKTISMIDMAKDIKATVGSDVIDVVVSGLGGDNNYEMLTVKDSSTRLSIRKKPVVLPNNELTVQDDVSVEFIRHLG